MHLNWNKRVLASSFAVLSMATSLYAIPRDPCEPICEPVCCEVPVPGPFAFAYPWDLGLNCPRDFYVHVDGLAFQAKQDGMDFAIEDTTSFVGFPTAPITYGKVLGFSDSNSDWDYNPGMRFGLGFYLDHDAWNIDLNWTWVNISNYKTVGATDNGVLIPLWLLGIGQEGQSFTGSFGKNANAVWTAQYNMCDFTLGKPYHVSRYIVFNPYFGLRGGWINQHFSVGYSGASPETSTTHHGQKNNFRGVGAKVGFNTDWIVGKGWWLFGNVSGSLVAGKFEVNQNLNIPFPQFEPDGFDIVSDYYQNVPNMEMAIGLGWSRQFDCCRYRISLKAAYEFIQWWDQLNMRKFYSGNPFYASDVVSRGNFAMNGFSLRLQLDI